MPTPSIAWWNWRIEGSPGLRDEGWAAYLKYWQTVAAAHRTLDTSMLADVLAGEQLARTLDAITELKSSGRAQDVRVDHNAQVLFGTPDQAVIYDKYVSSSVFVDLSTGLDIPNTDPPFTQQISFLLIKDDKHWRVTDAARHN